MNQKLQNIFDLIQRSEKLDAEQKENLLKAVKDADKELEITAFKLERTEKVKKTTAILLEETIEELEQKRKAVEDQNRELEIESSLERVRTVAMGMNKSEDLLSICEVSFKEFKKLGFDNIRNALIHIQYDEQKYFMDYDFSDLTGGAITKIEYGSHPVVEDYLMQIRSAKDAFYQGVIKEDELEEWKDFRRKSGQIDDPQLEKATALYYYFFSIGIGDIGISTLQPINESQIKILKRFRNVFDLAYRRYNDITMAEAQAKEAQIEAALERVRSRTMGMQKSKELKEVIQLVYEQFIHLNIHIEHTGFILDYKTRDDLHIWLANQREIPSEIIIPCFDSPPNNSIKDAKEKGQHFFKYLLTFEEKNKFYQDLFKFIPGVPEESLKYYFNCPGLAGSGVLLENVGLYIENFSGTSYTDEENNILMRFGKVFQQTYTRFLDLQKAEAQAKEAQIEAALERVRSRSLAMHHSSELSSVVDTLLREFTNLEFTLTFCIINLINEEDRSNTVWAANPETGKLPESYYMKFEDYPFHHAMWDAWKAQKKNFIYTIEGKEKKIYDEYLYTNTEFRRFPKHVQEVNKALKRYVAGFTFFKHSGLQTVSENHISEDELSILERFGRVFEQSYTRFLDLQKAEAQAKEAQIETALERVRAKTMSMHKSDELQDAAILLFQQVVDLGVQAFGTGFNIWDDDRKYATAWMAGRDRMQPPFKTSSSEDIFLRIYEAAEKGESLFVEKQGGEALKIHYKYMNSIPVFKEIADKMAAVGQTFPTFQIMHCAFFSHGYLMFISFEPVPDAYDIFKRFAKVFEQTYTRFLDLQKAEEQNKIIQAENDRKTKELEDARQLQLSMLPKKLPNLSHLDIAVYMKTATEVGGDYYDFNIDKNGTLTFIVGDATGHGMMSGMMVSIMKSFFIANRKSIELKDFFESSNNSIKEMKLGRLMMALSAIQITSEKVIATNAGMPSLMYFRNKSQKAGEFVSHNFPLGAMSGNKYSLKEINYESDDVILMMSDGFAELTNENNEQYGYSRIKEEFKSVASKNSNQIVEHLKDSALKWINGLEPDDDVTFVVIKFN